MCITNYFNTDSKVWHPVFLMQFVWLIVLRKSNNICNICDWQWGRTRKEFIFISIVNICTIFLHIWNPQNSALKNCYIFFWLCSLLLCDTLNKNLLHQYRFFFRISSHGEGVVYTYNLRPFWWMKVIVIILQKKGAKNYNIFCDFPNFLN